ncbi:hypothetical protein ACSZML_06865 [Aeromonas rivipollensis]
MKSVPKTGLYLSTKKVKGMRLVVEDVFAEEGDDFYLVNVIDEASKDDFLPWVMKWTASNGKRLSLNTA